MDSILNYRDTVSRTQALPASVFLERDFEPLTGPAIVTIDALARLEDQTVISDPQTGLRFAVQEVRVRVTVFAPNGDEVLNELVKVPVVGKPGTPIHFDVPKDLEDQHWLVHARNEGDKEITCTATVDHIAGRVILHSTRVAIRVLNHALRQLLFGLGIGVRLNGSKGEITLSPDLAVVLGKAPDPISFSLSKPVARDINLKTFTAHARTRGGPSDQFRGPYIRLFVEFETVGDREIAVEVGDLGDIDLADLDEATLEIDVRLLTVPGRRGTGVIVPSFSVQANIGIKKTFVGKLVSAGKDALGGQSFEENIDDIKRQIGETLREKVAPLISPYLTEGFLQLASRVDVLHDLIVDGDAFAIRHFDSEFRPAGGSDNEGPPELEPVDTIDPHDRGLPGGQPSLDKLMKIETFVVLMQENRSFDHMLGYLSLVGGRTDIDGLTGDESNAAPGDLVNDINLLEDTKFDLSPAHELEPVTAQIADGKMTGFLASFRERYPTARLGQDNPLRQSPMSFYGVDQLPSLDFLAARFGVCDRWFCSFPGATQPNRFCTLSGKTPVLNNMEIDDPRIGYFGETTIFDLLPPDVDWVYYENDVSSLRFYDRYRLDNTHIIPFDDERDGFHIRAASGTLPPVVFIDPDFVDVPLGRVPNDDHAPADLADGQALIRTVYNELVLSPQWPTLLFIITYDEHGGFFDHVAPPGTPVADDEASASGQPTRAVNAVHPDAPTYLGVRVPTVVVSPWVDAGTVSSLVFDHTSIGKSILLRFLGRDAPMLSSRMRQFHHLGELLAEEAHPDVPLIPPPERPRRPPREPETPPDGQTPLLLNDRHDKDEFHEAIRHFGQPLRRFEIPRRLTGLRPGETGAEADRDRS